MSLFLSFGRQKLYLSARSRSSGERGMAPPRHSDEAEAGSMYHADEYDNPRQLMRSPQELQLLLEDLLPLEDVVYAFGYGSGVLLQQETAVPNSRSNANETETKVIDLIVVVRDAERFHRTNRQRNPHHYPPWLRLSSGAAWLQRHQLPANTQHWLRNPGVYFVVSTTQAVKYGVVHVDDLSADLRDWSCLYLAGRLHKPVVTIPITAAADDDDAIRIAQLQHDHNLPAALSTALLLRYYQQQQQDPTANNSSTSHEIYTTIASLSYQGDPRMTLQAEDPDKVAKLVGTTSNSHWRSLYQPAAFQLQRAGILSISDNDSVWSWDSNSGSARDRLWQSLPAAVRRQCGYHPAEDDSTTRSTTASCCDATAALARLPTVLAQNIVAPAARYQSFKGLFTTGLRTSAAYAYRKFRKGGRGIFLPKW